VQRSLAVAIAIGARDATAFNQLLRAEFITFRRQCLVSRLAGHLPALEVKN
jgi:hypothetical protein